jgi:hypothetical protein
VIDTKVLCATIPGICTKNLVVKTFVNGFWFCLSRGTVGDVDANAVLLRLPLTLS